MSDVTPRMQAPPPPDLADRVALLAILGLTALILGAALLAGSAVRLAATVSVVCALAAGLCSLRVVWLAAAWAVLVRPLSFLIEPPTSTADAVIGVVVTTALALLSVAGAHLRVRHQSLALRARSAAVALQRQILQPLPLLLRHVEVHGLYLPVEEDTLVGGDLYEAVDSPHGTRVLIGDVQGKGLEAIGTGFAVLSAFREASWHRAGLADVADALDIAVQRHNATAAQAGRPERFTTALLLSFDGSSTVRAVACGHEPPLRIGPERTGPVALDRTGVPLGLAELTGEPRHAERFELGQEDVLLMTTDGVTEARDGNGGFYPLEQRLHGWRGLTPAEVVEALDADLRAYTAGAAADDITALAVHRGPPSTARTGRPRAGDRAAPPTR
ncbi:serine/threonine-protein phosphatase [Streptomyces sp. AV19]|uniref:PP2C family protein-serine/threonine phosphatase n=1 Tax=Streptomyces sp. AV19 TaxID=2793068 RepID=UPI0018FE0608|nr:PP2C family protein-serine/threonine phosphatase [Streptomyces sp. AV19]MBH1938095.1 serine/threonine-protein phosphatase [Streptomyces sp. AV19]MDG4533888.1 serine/threonine-protein phosphatase [Streptomyces sp. AV19]